MDEQFEVLRRICERMKADAERDAICRYDKEPYVDYANHLLAEIQATKRLYKETISG
jgi:hypothetical protein